MVRPVEGADELTEFLSDRRRNVVVLGPGGGVGRQDAGTWFSPRLPASAPWCSTPTL